MHCRQHLVKTLETILVHEMWSWQVTCSAHLAVLPEGVKADARCEVAQCLARPPPLLVHEENRLQHLLYVLQLIKTRFRAMQQTCRSQPAVGEILIFFIDSVPARQGPLLACHRLSR